MIRRRNTPWIHKWSRPLIGAIAICGALITGYLTYEKLTGGNPACTTPTGVKGCVDVLSSAWATVFGQPLALFGFLAYAGMFTLAVVPLVWKTEENKQTRKQLEYWTWWLLLIGAIAMSVFSGYLMYVLAFNIQALCLYCIGSAFFSLSMLTLTIVGRDWEDLGQIFFLALIVGMVTLIGTLGVYSGINTSGEIAESTSGQPVQIGAFRPAKNPNPEFGWEITTKSGSSEIALAQHLVQVKAKEYVSFTCPHCHEQKLLFGQEAYKILENNEIKVECNPNSPKAKVELCQAAKIEAFPSWIINGQTYSGVQNLEELANITGYKGPRNFKYIR
ncbi:MAG TPA: vitamin K epoxide reductase family protein [Nostocaceae cyanobacterium]|nr:vitamin K epoxide reductase family protein [Nostocaceae cyanobacterium]